MERQIKGEIDLKRKVRISEGRKIELGAGDWEEGRWRNEIQSAPGGCWAEDET